MKPGKPAITGSIDKDQLNYETNYNPENVSYIGPRVMSNHAIISTVSSTDAEDTY